MIKNDEDYLIRRTYTNYGGRKMCEYCEGKNLITISDKRIAVYINNQNKLKVLSDMNEYAKDINYCPMCGIKLGE